MSTHLDVLLGVLEVVEEGLVSPGDAGLLVGGGVGVSLGLAGLAAEEAVEVGSLLVGAALLDGVALRALGLEDLRSLLFVAALLAHGCCCFCSNYVVGRKSAAVVSFVRLRRESPTDIDNHVFC